MEAIIASQVSPEGHIRRYLSSVSPYRGKLALAGTQRFARGLENEPLGQAGHHRFSSLTRSARQSPPAEAHGLGWAQDFVKEGADLPVSVKRAGKVGKEVDDWKAYEGMDDETADRLHARKMKRRAFRRMRRGQSMTSSTSSPPHQHLAAATPHRAASEDPDLKRYAKQKRRQDKENEANAIMINYKAKNVTRNRLTLQRKLPTGKGLFARGVSSVQMPVPSQKHHAGFDQKAFLTHKRAHLRRTNSRPSIEWESPSQPSHVKVESAQQVVPVKRRRYAPGELPPPGLTGSPSWPTILSDSRGQPPPSASVRVSRTTPVIGKSPSILRSFAAHHAHSDRSRTHPESQTAISRFGGSSPIYQEAERRIYGQIIPFQPLESLALSGDGDNDEISIDWRTRPAAPFRQSPYPQFHFSDIHPIEGAPPRYGPSPLQDDIWQESTRVNAAIGVSPRHHSRENLESVYGSPILRAPSIQPNPFLDPSAQPQYGHPGTYPSRPQWPIHEPLVRQPHHRGAALRAEGPIHVPMTPVQQLSSAPFRFASHGKDLPQSFMEGQDRASIDLPSHVNAHERSNLTPGIWTNDRPLVQDERFPIMSSAPRLGVALPFSSASISLDSLTDRTNSSDAVERYGTTHDEYKRLWTARRNIL